MTITNRDTIISQRGRLLSYGKHWLHKMCCTLKLLERACLASRSTNNLNSVSFCYLKTMWQQRNIPFHLKRSFKPMKILILCLSEEFPLMSINKKMGSKILPQRFLGGFIEQQRCSGTASPHTQTHPHTAVHPCSSTTAVAMSCGSSACPSDPLKQESGLSEKQDGCFVQARSLSSEVAELMVSAGTAS